MINIVLIAIAMAFSMFLVITGFAGNLSSVSGGLGWGLAFVYQLVHLIKNVTDYRDGG